MNDRNEWMEEMPAEAAGGQPAFDVLGILQRRKWLILLGIVVGIGGGYLYFLQQPAEYESSARMLVIKKSQPVPIQGIESGGGTAKNPLQDQTIIIRELIVKRAIEDKRLDSLRSLHGTGNAEAIVKGGLQLSTTGNVLDLRFRGPDPQDCAHVLKALVETYQDFMGEAHQDVGQEMLKLISQAKDDLGKQLAEKDKAYRKFREEAPLLWQDIEGLGTNIHQARLVEIEKARSTLLLRRSQLKAKIQAIESAIARGDNRLALMLSIGQPMKNAPRQESRGEIAEGDDLFSNENDTDLFEPLAISDEMRGIAEGSASIAQRLFPMLLEEQMLLERYGHEHPKLMLLRKKIAIVRDFYVSMSNPGQAGAGDEPVDFLAVYVESLHQQFRASEETEKELTRLFKQEQDEAKSLTIYQVNDGSVRKDIARTERLYDAVVNRLEEINLIKDYGGYNTQVLNAARVGRQVAPNMFKILLIAGIFGLVGGSGLAVLVDLADKTFHSPADVTRHLRMPLVGHIPMIPTTKKRKKSDPASPLAEVLVTVHKPKSQLAEAYRVVRTALYFSSQNKGHKVIQITSPTPGDGKTTLACNLAVSIAHSGKKVLLLDADFRRPSVHKQFGIPRDVGLASVISEEAELSDAIQDCGIDNLSVMACGPRPHNPSELLTSPRFKELLAVLREQYDFVLIDSPPILAVTDPSAVAARVDGVLLTLRIRKNVRLSSSRAIEMLNTLGADVLGVVVNGVGEKRGYGYGYGGYRYGGYRYGGYNYAAYNYGYGQSYGEYYADDDDQPHAKTNGAAHRGPKTLDLTSRER